MVKVGIVQSKVSSNPYSNLKRVKSFFQKGGDCDFICFPECFLTGPEDLKSFNKEIPNMAKKLFSKLSKKYKIYSVMGSIHEKKNKKLVNVSYLFNKKGEIVGSYQKISLVPRTEEIRDLIPGNKTPVFKTEFGKVGIQICRDLFYPEITKRLAKKGANIIFCPAFWSYKSKDYLPEMKKKYSFNTEARVVDSLVSARSIENGVIFIFANATGEYSNKRLECEEYLLGHTQVALPFFGVTNSLKSRKEGIIIKEIDLDIIKDAKKAYLL